MKEKIKPCISFMFALIFLISSIPVPAMESQANGLNVGSVISGNIIDEKEAVPLSSPLEEAVSGNDGDNLPENPDDTKCIITISCNDMDNATITVFSDENRVDPVNSQNSQQLQYSVEVGKRVKIVAEPDDYYQVVLDSANPMKLTNEEKGIYEWEVQSFNSDTKKDYIINIREIEKVNITYNGIYTKISRQMRGGKVTAVSENDMEDCVEIVPDTGYCVNFFGEPLTPLNGNVYCISENASVFFKKDDIPPEIEIINNDCINDTWYIKGDDDLYVKIIDDAKEEDIKVDINPPVAMEPLGGFKYKFAFRGMDFNGKEEIKKFIITASDGAGHKGKRTITIIYDSVSPEVCSVSINSTKDTFLQNGKQYFGPKKEMMEVSVNVEENIGISHLNYIICKDKHDEDWSEADFYENQAVQKIELSEKEKLAGIKTKSISINDLDSGTYYIYFAATDLAGNRQTGELPFAEFHIDKTPPEINVEESGKWYNKSEEIGMEAEISDEHTADGLSYKYSLVKLAGKNLEDYESEKILQPEGEWEPLGVSGKGETDYEISLSVSENEIPEINENGTYAVLIWAKDGCGNESGPKGYVFHYDNVPPKMDEFEFEVTEGNEKVVDKFKKFYGNFFRLEPISEKDVKQEVFIKVRAYDDGQYLGNYSQGTKLEIKDVHAYYIKKENEKSEAIKYKNSEAEQTELPQFGQETKLYRKSADSNTYEVALSVPKEAVFYELMIVARDKAGNIHCAFPKDFDKTLSNLVMVDNKGPEIDLKIDEKVGKEDYKEITRQETKYWYKGDRPISHEVEVEDSGSGISDLQIKINEKPQPELGEKFEGDNLIGKEEPFTKNINLQKNCIEADGRYALYAISHDNAGNTGESKGEAPNVIYIDEDAPVITKVSFTSDNKENPDNSESQHSFFFKGDKEVTVTVTATDYIGSTSNLGSGVKYIIYRLEYLDGRIVSEEVRAVPGGNNKYIASLNIAPGFNGRVSVTAKDQVGNSGQYIDSYGLIINSPGQHEKDSSAKIEMNPTLYKDANGNPLYRKKPEIRFKTIDKDSGIAENSWKVKAANDKKPEKEQKVIVKTGHENGKYTSKLEADAGWSIVKTTKWNLPIGVNGTYQVTSEKNSIEASLTMRDNAGNTTKAAKKTFSVDSTPPKVFVEYDNNEAYNGKFYKEKRYATIHVIDANFSAENCDIKTTGPGVSKSEWQHIPGSGCNGKVHSGDCEYTCQVGFVTDGDYTFGFECTDLAGWTGSYGQIDEFTIDMTEPVIQVSYDNQNAQNGNFYKDARTATIQIEEHNFEPEDVTVTITAMDGGNAINVPPVVGWTKHDDIHTATIAYDYDGEFTFDIEYTDLADNKAEEYEQDQFVIDVTEPEIEITGITDRSANKGGVQPVITCNDTNLEDAVISLKGVNRGNVKADYEVRRAGSGIVYKMKDLEHIKKNDDIYTLHITARDKAGNEYEEEIHYSVNRFGSVYQYDKQTETLINNYYSSACGDLVVKEINVNTLKAKRVTYSKDGEIVTLQEGKDYRLSQSGDEFNWKEYVYTIFKENFEEDGKYILTLYSEDLADNHSDNRVKGKNIEFVMDRTAPSLVLSGIKDGGQYNENTKELVINAEDNIGLAGVEVYNDGIQIADFDGETITEANGTLSISLQSKNDWQELTVITRDMAGNENRSETLTYLITTNLLVQWYKNPWLFYGSMVIILLLAGMTEYFVQRRKGQKKKRMVG